MISLHNHTDKSNFRLVDCIIKTENLLKRAIEIGLEGVAITDHETVSAHVEAIQKVKEMKEKGKMPKDFKLILGNEIYLVDSLEEVRDNYKGGGVTKFPHFILLAKDKEGHKQLRELSSIAWENSFKTGQMERVPTVKTDLERIIKHNPGHLIASTACLGGELPYLILALLNPENKQYEKDIKYRVHSFLTWCIDLFGRDNFFIELQPSVMQEQIIFNKKAIEIARAYDLKWIITTDSHYLKNDNKTIHEAYLNSKDGDREVADFYSSTYLMNEDEITPYLDQYISQEDIQAAYDTTRLIGSMIEEYDLSHPVIVPKIDIPDFKLQHLFKPAYNKYGYIEKFAHSDNAQERYLLKLVEDGFNKKLRKPGMSKDEFHEIMARIDVELGELWEITQQIQNEVSAYYITTREIINLMWEEGDSLVGVARGSVTGFLVAYLIDITQLNPLKWNLPHWRHLHKERPELPDIDLDSQANRRRTILDALKVKFGERRVLNICTFGTEGSRSAILTACRGLGIDNDTAQYLADMIPFERGQNWSLKDCIEGDEDKGRRPVREFIKEVGQYEGLLEVAMGIEGLVNKRSIHASGVYVFDGDFLEQNARMRAPNGQFVTQYNMGDSDYMGGLKVDLLTIEALDKIRLCLDMLIKDGYIKWKGSLRATYNAYIHPDVIDYDTPEMWKMIGDNAIVDLFQFDTEVGLIAAQKTKPTNMFELAVVNSLMRLMSDGEEQPVDAYIKYKNDINLWYKEMKDYGLTDDEITILEKHLKKIYGVADTQEVVMQLVMDEHISNMSVKGANKVRKGIAKKKGKVQEEARKEFYELGQKVGTSLNLLNYVWNVQVARQLGYSFSINHTTPYSCIALQEMNLAYHFPMIYWQTACLSINAAADEDNNNNKSTDYGKIAAAIGNMQHKGVTVALPDINEADFGFRADIKNNRIIFGLKGINGIGDEVVYKIIKNRPYTSIDDFINRMASSPEAEDEAQAVKSSQMVQLIKAGCFDALPDAQGKILERSEVMEKFIKTICKPKEKLTMANLNMLIENEILPEKYQVYSKLAKLKEYITEKVHELIPPKKADAKKKYSDRLLVVDGSALEFYKQHFTEDILDYKDGVVVVSENKFKKEYDKKMGTLKEWMGKPETLAALNQKLFENTWNDRCPGNISAWEMESLSFYYHDHEMSYLDKDKYNLADFTSLPEEPPIIGTYKIRDKERYKYDIVRIGGTVLDKDKHKHTVTLLTTTGVVTIKFYGGAFAHYDKQISREKGDGKKEILEGSWFSRGNKLFVCGYRKGNQFRPYKYADSIYQHTITLITNINEDGSLDMQTERVRA